MDGFHSFIHLTGTMVSKYSYKLATDTVHIEFKAYANSQLQSQVGFFAVKYKICINYKKEPHHGIQ